MHFGINTLLAANKMKLVIVSGRSGSGKSTALHMLEDAGFYCVDNLPAGLLPELVIQALAQDDSNANESLIAIGIDARNVPGDLSRFAELFAQIPDRVDTSIIFLDAANSTLLRRFSETRRKHPLSTNDVSLQEAIEIESQMLDNIATMAHLTIDTSNMNLHELRGMIANRVGNKTSAEMSLLFQSFGFKHSLPIDSDLVFDARCLPNPYWKPELRAFTGIDRPVKDFLKSERSVGHMVQDIIVYLEKWLPEFSAAHRSYTTVSIGCTGGKHRSVYIANQLYQHFRRQYRHTQVRHRDMHLQANTTDTAAALDTDNQRQDVTDDA